MNLLELAQALADETLGPRPPRIANNDAPAARNLLRTINKTGLRLVNVDLHAWSFLTKSFQFHAPGPPLALRAADFPADFARLIPDTLRVTAGPRICGPALPAEWAHAPADPEPPLFFRMADGIRTRPARRAGEALEFLYVSNHWVRTGTHQTPCASMRDDDDTAVFDPELIILFAKQQWLLDMGQDWQPTAAAANQALLNAIGYDAAAPSQLITADVFAPDHTGPFQYQR